jgi:hypothetical protein
VEKKFNFVYITTNLINNKKYVGDHSTNNIENDNYLGSGRLFSKKIKEYGKQNFKREILEFFDTKQEAFDAQEKYIKLYETHISQHGYNINYKGGYRFSGPISDETRKKIGKASTNRIRKPHSNECKLKMKLAWELRKLIPMSNETKRKISESSKGKVSATKGIKIGFRSLETKEKIRKSLIGVPHTEERKKNTSLRMKRKYELAKETNK